MSWLAEDAREQEPEVPRASFEEFVAAWYELVDLKARAKVRDPNLAKDLAHQTWMKAWKAWDRGVRPRDPQSWLLTILRNEFRSLFRRRPILSLVAEPAVSPGRHPVETEEERIMVRRVLKELAPEDREILLLRYVEGLPPGELQRRIDCSRATFFRRLADARRRFLDIFRSREE